ncbi:hypothetical protein [Actinomadura sp. CNU-125]|uniref:hypothetical protein n=1 Tax=Actinomadura sp. CNU-125 TaxID=1904961 RepID=UPI0021CC5D46|nr:hypothetical protein [Actinomadura sp. CNU-125]
MSGLLEVAQDRLSRLVISREAVQEVLGETARPVGKPLSGAACVTRRGGGQQRLEQPDRRCLWRILPRVVVVGLSASVTGRTAGTNPLRRAKTVPRLVPAGRCGEVVHDRSKIVGMNGAVIKPTSPWEGGGRNTAWWQVINELIGQLPASCPPKALWRWYFRNSTGSSPRGDE